MPITEDEEYAWFLRIVRQEERRRRWIRAASVANLCAVPLALFLGVALGWRGRGR